MEWKLALTGPEKALVIYKSLRAPLSSVLLYYLPHNKARMLLTASILGFILLIAATADAMSNTTFQVNAIVGKNDISQLECWSLLPGFSISTQVS